MNFQTSKTYQNLLTSYHDELISCGMYLIYSDVAKSEGYIEIGNIYDMTAVNEKEHSRIWLRQLNQGVLPDTTQALLDSIQYEDGLAAKYQEFVQTAKEEGFTDIAALFSGIANIALFHSSRFRFLNNNIQAGEVFCKKEQTLWICMQCGNILSGECAPEICPVCGFPQGYYKLYDVVTYT